MKSLFSCIFGLLILFFAVEVYAATGIKWDAPINGGPVANYTVYYGEGTVVSSTFSKTVSASVTGVDFTALNMGAGKTYTFIVKASNDAGEGPASNSVTYEMPKFTPPIDVLPPVPATVPGTAVLQLK
jgi:hypothetical protein